MCQMMYQVYYLIKYNMSFGEGIFIIPFYKRGNYSPDFKNVPKILQLRSIRDWSTSGSSFYLLVVTSHSKFYLLHAVCCSLRDLFPSAHLLLTQFSWLTLKPVLQSYLEFTAFGNSSPLLPASKAQILVLLP